MKPMIPNTFGVSVTANKVVTVTSAAELLTAWQQAQADQQPVIILGEGSNTLFTTDFAGIIIVNRIMGITITETDTDWLLYAGAGEKWHNVVSMAVEQGKPGLENLALIPGCVGSAPIQNIGAYGVEFKKFADYVDLLALATGKVLRIEDGQYGYRDSIFKHQYQEGYAVIGVGMRLPKQWRPVLAYGDLQKLEPSTVTAKLIFETVCQIRRSKLPDPKVLGNGGSFFKNPVVEKSIADEIQKAYPAMPYYLQPNEHVKLAAGWLIDQCGLKGYQIGGAAVHEQQALVLVNKAQATAQDVVNLARYIRQTVIDKFNVALEPEIRFIGTQGEIDAVALLDSQ